MNAVKRLWKLAGVAGLCLVLSGCGTKDADEEQRDGQQRAAQGSQAAEENSNKAQAAIATVNYNGSGRPEADCKVMLMGDDAQCDGEGAVFHDGVLSISKAGCYEISGSLSEGRIEVNATKDDNIEVVLKGVDVTCSDYAPFVVWQADGILVYLEEGTQNTFVDGGSYAALDGIAEDDAPTAAFFSKDKLVFDGGGSLTVNAYCNDGITGKDDVWFENGTYVIHAKDDGIVGRDSVSVKDGTFTIEAQGDGIKSTHASDEGKGFVYILGGVFDIAAACDGIQGETYVWAEGGSFDIIAGNGSSNVASQAGMMDRRGRMEAAQEEDGTSMKGVKAGVDVTIKGGAWRLDCADDAFHSNSTATFSGGTFEIQTGDDGIHADDAVDIEDGSITVERSYEGIEAEVIAICGGNIDITASDDGLNAANGESSEGMDGPGGMGAQPGENGSGTGVIYIEGGNIYVDASGDGIDSNGSIYMSGGTVYVDGPTNDGNGFLDYDSEFLISGGTFVAVGSSGMMQTASEDSAQPVMAFGTGGAAQAGTEITVKDSTGREIISYTPSKQYMAAVVSCPDLALNDTYDIYVGGIKCSSIELTSSSATDGTVRVDGQPAGMGGRRSMGDRGQPDMDVSRGVVGPNGEQPPGEGMAEPGGQKPDLAGAGSGQGSRDPDGEMPSVEEGDIPDWYPRQDSSGTQPGKTI